MITLELLDALLAVPCNRENSLKEAESYYKSLSTQDRLKGLVTILISLSQDEGNNQGGNSGRKKLAAVLLRKEIVAASPESNEELELLKQLVSPLMRLFLSCVSDASLSSCAKSYIHCITELCTALSIQTESGTSEEIMSILNALTEGCVNANALVLNLLGEIASQTPITFFKSIPFDLDVTKENTLGPLLGRSLNSLVHNYQMNDSCVEGVEAYVKLLVNVASACDVVEKESKNDDTPVTSQIKHKILSQIPNLHSEHEVNLSSASSKLGSSFLLPVLEAILKFTSYSSSFTETTHFLVRSCLDHISTSARNCPSFIAGTEQVLSGTVVLCLSIAGIPPLAGDSEEILRTKLAALQTLTTICETKVTKIIFSKPNILSLLLNGTENGAQNHASFLISCSELITLGVDKDIESWSKGPISVEEDIPSWDEDDVATHAESLVEQFIRSIGGNETQSFVLRIVEELFKDECWNKQRAALVMMEKSLSAASDVLASHLPTYVDIALRLSRKENYRVQFQALQLIRALLHADTTQHKVTVFGSNIPAMNVKKHYGGQIMNFLGPSLSSPNHKVALMSCLTISSYCRGGDGMEDNGISCDAELIVPYLSEVLSALSAGPLSQIHILNRAPQLSGEELGNTSALLVQAIGSLACLANSAEGGFVDYYNNVMPTLITCCEVGLEMNGRPLITELAFLRGVAIEVCSVIGQAVGEQVFTRDAERCMNILVSVLKLFDISKLSGDWCSISDAYMPLDKAVAAVARIISIFGENQNMQNLVLPIIIPILLTQLNQPSDISIDEAGLTSNPSGELESVKIALPGIGEKKISINTSVLEEKVVAARATYEISSALPNTFSSFADEFLKVLLPLTTFKYSPEVRCTSAQAIVPIFLSVLNSNRTDSPEILHGIYSLMINQLTIEDFSLEIDCPVAISDAVSECLRLGYYEGILEKNDVSVVVDNIKKMVSLIGDCFGRRGKLSADSKTVKDTIKFESKLQNEQEFLRNLVDSIGYHIKAFRTRFVPYFDQIIHPVFEPILTKDILDSRALHASLCFYIDCIEYGGSEAANKYSPILLQGVKHGMYDVDMDVIQVSVYGVAQVSRHAHQSILSPMINTLVPQILQLIHKSRENGNAMVLEDAIFALASLVVFKDAPFSSSVEFGRNKMLNLFLDSLPFRVDEEESKICINELFHLVESRLIDLTSQAPNLIRVIADSLYAQSEGSETVPRETVNQYSMILRTIQTDVPGNIINNCLQKLTPEAQTALQVIAN